MMIVAAWLVYCIALSVVLTAGAFAWESAARWSGRTTRWVWLGALAGSISLPWLLRLVPARAWPEAVPAAVPVFAIDPLAVGAPAAGGWPAVELALAGWATLSLAAVLYLALLLVRLNAARRGWQATELDGGRVFVTRTLGPGAVGIGRGVVVLPAWVLALDAELRTLLLQHEREHVRAGDPRTLLAALGLVALAPWNFVAWFQLLRLRNAIEVDCDTRVLAGGADPERYGSLLLEVGRRRSGGTLVMATFAEPRVFLRERIRRIAHWPVERRRGRAAAFGMLALALFATALSARDPVRAGAGLAALSGVSAHGGMATSPAAPSSAGDPARLAGASSSAESSSLAAPSSLELAVDTPPPVRAVPPRSVVTPMSVAPELRNRPAVVQAVRDNYPPLLRDAGIRGNAVIAVFVDEKGVVQKVEVASSTGYPALDQAAVAVARVMEFRPALNNGAPTAVWVELPINFGAQTVVAAPPAPPPPPRGVEPQERPAPARSAEAEARLARVGAEPVFTPYTVAPELLNREEVQRALVRNYPPMLRDAGIGGAPTVHLFIDEAGTVRSTRLSRSGGYPALDEAALRVAATMRFASAVNRDEPVAVWIELPIVFTAR
jgi:TonB family protein